MIERIPTLLSELAPIFKRQMADAGGAPSKDEREKIRSLREAYNSVRSILVVRLDAIGDWVLFYSSLRKIRTAFRNAEITVVAYNDIKDIVENSPYVKGSFLLDRKAISTSKGQRESVLAQLSELSFDLIINPLYSRELTSDEIVHFVDAKVKIGVAGDNTNILPALRPVADKWYSYLLPVDNTKTVFELHRNDEMLNFLGIETGQTNLPEVAIPESELRFVEKLLRDYNLKDYVVVFPSGRGAEKSMKYWGTRNFTELVDALAEKGLQVVILGAPKDDVCFDIARDAKSTPIVLVGQSSLWESAAILKRALFFVGTDTSMAHVAAGLKIPTVVPLNGAQFGRFFPYPGADNVMPVYHEMTCYGCNWNCIHKTVECIERITLDQVLEKCDEALQYALSHKQQARSEETRQVNRDVRYVRNTGSTPRIDLVLPGGFHCYHFKEAWLMKLKAGEYLNRSFWPTAENTGRLFEYLSTGGNSDMIIVLGGDHHLSYLHDTKRKIEEWSKFKGPRVCYSFESSIDTVYPEHLSRAIQSLDAFTHFLYVDELDGGIYDQYRKPALWFPQFAEHNMYVNRVPFSKRKPRAVFSGKLWSEFIERRAVIEALEKADLCDVVDFQPTGSLVNLYNEYMISVNPPGMIGSFNTRAYESLATGSLLYQFLPPDRPKNNSLFKDGEHLFYFDTRDVDGLISHLRHAVRNIQSIEAVARKGYEELASKHTLDIRLSQLLKWVFEGEAPRFESYGTPTALGRPRAEGANAGLVYAQDAERIAREAAFLITQLREDGQIDRAIDTALVTLRTTLGLPSLKQILAELRIQKGQSPEARFLLKEILRKAPLNINALNNLAVVELMDKHYPEALRILKQVLQREPTNETAIMNLGYLQKRLQSVKESLVGHNELTAAK